LIHDLYKFNHTALILDNIGTTYIQWGRSLCTADDTDIVYSGKNVQSIDLGYFPGDFSAFFCKYLGIIKHIISTIYRWNIV